MVMAEFEKNVKDKLKMLVLVAQQIGSCIS